ncbi:hypothetical protein FRC08_001754 [Ceratobasidium sp. 394]|nr:hypothetical protein FRC08_001754 [Ceratobasidium sp. 394]
MPAVVQAYASLVYRYTRPDAIPPENDPWNCFPFNNDRFRELASIKSIAVGLSEPPTGKAGDAITPTLRSLWPRKATGALKYLKFCDAERRKMANPPTIESFQKNVLKTAPNRDDWEWIVNHFFGASGGLYDRLRDIMRDSRCDAEEAYRYAREEAMETKDQEFREGNVRGICKFDNVWLSARDTVGLAVCGDPRGTGRVPNAYHPTLRAICYRLFEGVARTLQRHVTDIQPLEAKLARAYKDADEHPTLSKLRKAINLYSTVVSVQRALGIRDRHEELGIWRQRLDTLMEGLGRKVKGGKTVRVTARHRMAHVVSDEDLNTVWMEYRAELWVPKPARTAGAENVEEDEEAFTDRPLAALNAFPLNAGVERWMSTSSVQIQEMLGIPKGGLPGANRDENGRPTMHLMWHQWASVAEMIDRTFTLEGEPGRPTLLADEVGMGKTAQVIGYLQVLWHLKALQDANTQWPSTTAADGIVKWPEFLGDRKFFMGKGRIPALPTVIACPTTLVAQWRHELSTWLSDTSCHVLVYRGNVQERDQFFAENSPYDRAMKGPHPECTVILVEVPSLQASGRTALYEPGDRARAEPSTGHPDLLKNTLFSRDFLLAVLEEGHGYRNWNQSYRTVLTLMSRASQAIVLTATPVHTHPRDLLQLGRLCRAPRFIGSNGATLTKNVEQKFKDSGKAWDSDQEQDLLRQFLLSLRGSNLQSDSETSDASQIIDLLPQQEKDILTYRAFWGTREGLWLLRAALSDILIRRDDRSKDIDGNPLLGLLPKIEITSYLKLDAVTEAALSAETATKEARNRARMDLDGFFTRLKKILVHHILMRERPPHLSFEEHVQALFPTLAAYQNNPSPKLDRLIRVLKHHSGDENADAPPLSWNEDGTECSSDELFKLARDSSGDSKRRKIVVYCHLSQSWTLVAHVLKLHGIETLCVNGSMEPAQRDAAVRSFQAEDGPDVLLLSDAGAQGLNLQRGSIVVYVDHPWSASEAQQIDGRVQRRGQKRQVIIYRLMAPGTPDEYLLGYADGKRLMMQVFTQECVTRGRPGFEHEDREEEDDEGSDTETGSKKAPRKTKVVGRAAKETGDTADPDETPNPDPADDDLADDKPATTKAKRKNAGAAPKAKKSKPEPYIHPDHPDLGARPKEGTQARERWDKRLAKAELKKALVANQIQRDVEDKIRQQVQKDVIAKFEDRMRESIRAAKQKAAVPSTNVVPMDTAEPDDATTVDKGKGKAAENRAADEPPSLTAVQSTVLSMLCGGMISVEQAQRTLEAQNHPPIPVCYLPPSSTPEASGSGSGSHVPASTTPGHSQSPVPASSEAHTSASDIDLPLAPASSSASANLAAPAVLPPAAVPSTAPAHPATPPLHASSVSHTPASDIVLPPGPVSSSGSANPGATAALPPAAVASTPPPLPATPPPPPATPPPPTTPAALSSPADPTTPAAAASRAAPNATVAPVSLAAHDSSAPPAAVVAQTSSAAPRSPPFSATVPNPVTPPAIGPGEPMDWAVSPTRATQQGGSKPSPPAVLAGRARNISSPLSSPPPDKRPRQDDAELSASGDLSFGNPDSTSTPRYDMRDRSAKSSTTFIGSNLAIGQLPSPTGARARTNAQKGKEFAEKLKQRSASGTRGRGGQRG